MATVRDRGEVTTVGRGRPGASRPSRRHLTLADLIGAIQDVVGPEADGLVVATMRHLLRSGPLTGRGTGGVAQFVRRGQTREREGRPVARLSEFWLQRIAGNQRERRRSITGKE
jgi:hypothetical protein